MDWDLFIMVFAVIGIAILSFGAGVIWIIREKVKIEEQAKRMQKKVGRIEVLKETKEITKEIDSRRKQ